MLAYLRRNYAWLLLFFAAIAVVKPIGEFPLNDDWAYALSVRHLLSGHGLVVPDWATPTLILHTLYGAFWSALLGPSFSALRVSTLAISFAALLFMGKASGSGRAGWPAALSAQFLLLASPMFMLLSFTFMTDVPYVCWLLLALYFCQRALESGKTAHWLLAGVAISLAYMVRQLALAVVVAALAAMFLERKLSWRSAAALCALPLAVFLAHAYWFNEIYGGTWASHVYVGKLSKAFYSNAGNWPVIAFRFLDGLFYAALFCLPLALLFPSPLAGKRSRFLAFGACWLGLVLLFWGGQGLPPYYMSVLTDSGFGAITLTGAKDGGYMSWSVLRAAALFAGAFSMARLAANWRLFLGGAQLFLLAAAGAQLALCSATRSFHDRYALPVFACLLLAAFRAVQDLDIPRWKLRLASSAALLMAVVSLAGTWDYLNWQRAKHALTSYAVSSGMDRARLCNGLDGYAGVLYEEKMALLKQGKPLDEIGDLDWLKDTEFDSLICFGNLDGGPWRLLAEERYFSPLTLRREHLSLYALPAGRHFHVDRF